ncbi:MAG: orotidine-5'-phosphate decarboxylase [Candidatus Diapherotrites archaeon]|nr:orotidine-5'-phosphate decarboxylase [Candidatus Diapherotrites archaeon]
MNFADRLFNAIEKKQNPSVVGLDPRISQIPDSIKQERVAKFGDTPQAVAASFVAFNKKIIDAIKGIVPAVKPQMAFYEAYGPYGVEAFQITCKYAQDSGLLVIGDAKRNDIGSTAVAYAKGFLGEVNTIKGKARVHYVDALTVNSYLGSDGVKPFVDEAKNGKGAFLLVKTSNPSSGELQDLRLKEGETVYEAMAKLVDKWGEEVVGERGYSSIGAVVGATYPGEAQRLRLLMPKTPILVPGYGAQGGGAMDTMPCFNDDGYGAIVNSSRGIIFAYQKKGGEYDAAARDAALAMKRDLSDALMKKGIYPW